MGEAVALRYVISSASARGNVSVKVVPTSTVLCTATCPLCAAITSCTIYSPSPVPPGFVVCSGSKIRAVVLGGNAAAGIPQVELDRRPLPSPLERQGPPLGHGVSRVVHKVEEHPPEGMRMQHHLAELREARQLERDPVRGKGRGHLLRKRGHEQTQVHRGQRDRPRAHQGEIILKEIVDAREIRLNLRERLGDLGAGGATSRSSSRNSSTWRTTAPSGSGFTRQPGGEAAQEGKVLGLLPSCHSFSVRTVMSSIARRTARRVEAMAVSRIVRGPIHSKVCVTS